MNLLSVLWGFFLVLYVVDGYPVDKDTYDDISFPKTEDFDMKDKVRQKRKSDEKAPVINAITAEKPAESEAVEPMHIHQDLKNIENVLFPVSMHINEEDLEGVARAKKHIFPKDYMGKAAIMDIPRAAPSDVIILRNEPVEYVPMTQQTLVRGEPVEYVPINLPAKALPRATTRTLEPIISLGPMSVNSHGQGFGSSAYSGGLPVLTTSVLGQTSYSPTTSYGYSPSNSYSYSPSNSYGVRPFYQQGHHHPYLQHTISLRQPTYVDLGPVIYYDRQSDVAPEAASIDEPVSLYCQPLKSSELSKIVNTQDQIAPLDRKLNESEHYDNPTHHMKKVNQIQEEITQLNKAAQKLVEQQESLAKMQQEHMARAAGAVYPNPMYKPMDMRMPPYHHMYGGYPMRPLYPYRSADGEEYDDNATQPPSFHGPSQKPPQEQEKQKTKNLDHASKKAASRSETGFPVPTFLSKHIQNPTSISEEDLANFFKILQNTPKGKQFLKPEEGKHQNEDAVTDLMKGQKLAQTEDEEGGKLAKEKRDSRGLVN